MSMSQDDAPFCFGCFVCFFPFFLRCRGRYLFPVFFFGGVGGGGEGMTEERCYASLVGCCGDNIFFICGVSSAVASYATSATRGSLRKLTP